MLWDPNPELNVTAYRIFVGSSPGVVDSTFDVPGTQASFAFDAAVRGRRYYFSVAAQVDDAVWGPKSTEVSEVAAAGAVAVGSDRPSSSLAPTPTSTIDSAAASLAITVADGLQDVTALMVSPEGEGLLVEHSRVVRGFDQGGLGPEPALELDDDSRVEDLIQTPDFARSRQVLLAISRSSRHGQRELTLERHRLVAGSLGEAAVVVPGIEAASSSQAAVAMSTDRRMFVAQAGAVFSFATNGVPAGEATALRAETGAAPSLLYWPTDGSLWIAYHHQAGSAEVHRLSPEGAHAVTTLAVPTGGRPRLVPVGQRVALVTPTAAGLHVTDVVSATAQEFAVALPTGSEPVLAAPAATGWYVVARRPSSAGAVVDSLWFVPARGLRQ